MSTAVIRTGAEVPTLESFSVELNHSLPRGSTHTSEDQIAHGSGEAGDRGLRYDATPEDQLVSAAKGGDQRAFAELCRRHIPSLKPWIRRLIRNPEDSEDVLQETLLKAYKHMAAFRSKSSFRTWIMSIATNNSLMLLRKQRNHPESGLTHVTADGNKSEVIEIADPLPSPEEIFARQQANQRVAQAVRRLPPGFRLIVERYHHEEVKLVDAASAIGITETAAKSRLLRARKTLRRYLNCYNRRHNI